MKNCPHKWLITYDDSEYIKELFSFASIRSWNLTYGMRNVTDNSDQKGNELFISNYDIYRAEVQQSKLFTISNIQNLLPTTTLEEIVSCSK